MTALIDAMRGVMLAGAGVADIAHEKAILSVWTVVCFGTALKIFRWQ